MRNGKFIEDVQRELLSKIQTEGVQAAYEASLAVCRDLKAPAPARATASATLFRVAGYFNEQKRDPTKEPHEMTADEISSEIRRLSRVQQSPPDENGVFD